VRLRGIGGHIHDESSGIKQREIGNFRGQTAPNRARLQPARGGMLAALQKSVSS
jgi:hypothetical protein